MNASDRPEERRAASHQTARISFVRGCLFALPASAAGFALPYLLLGAIPFVRSALFQYPLVERDADLQALSMKAWAPAIGCAIVFALAAILSHMPARRGSFIRSLMFVGLFALLGLFVTAAATIAFDLGPRSYTSDPYGVARGAIAIGVLVACWGVMLYRAILAKP